MGIHVYLHETPCPTPQLSFAVRFLHAAAGIVITASHNPKEYNGYKVYDEFGCQLVPSQAKQVISYIDQITDYRIIQFMGNASLISMVDVTDDFALSVIKQSRYKESGAKKKLKIVYTPLHGTGNIPVRKVLGMDGFSQVAIVEEQAVADGGFLLLFHQIRRIPGRWKKGSVRRKIWTAISFWEQIRIATGLASR